MSKPDELKVLEMQLHEIMLENAGNGLQGRNPQTLRLLSYFIGSHLPVKLQGISDECADLACQMVKALPDSPELTVGLRKLLEAKDCFVRAALDD